SYATKIDKRTLHTLIFYLLIFLSLVLFSHIFIEVKSALILPLILQIVLGFIIGIGIGMVSSLLGVAGGELLIPTIVLLYATDIKTAGTLSLAISLPTLLVGLYRYHKNGRLLEVLSFRDILIWMSIGSIIGAFIGATLFGKTDAKIIELLLAIILLLSAYKLFKKEKK
ncbi:sulfite exporter TauE/SafE family protein, partial [Sulfurimonas sp.]|uniref:sulfite exporter TauE/SafE family protein n=1 Tax=Sulfurimonas sp. TaxID=2022749 RepID=UPI0025E2737C